MKCMRCFGHGKCNRKSKFGKPFDITCSVCHGTGSAPAPWVRERLRRLRFWTGQLCMEEENEFQSLMSNILAAIDLAEKELPVDQ